jgi:hypothetical protein
METQIKKKTSKKEVADLEELKGEFEQVKKTPLTRWVKLVYKSCCGCGCNDLTIKRKVPYDSSLKDGDRASILEKNDQSL